MADLDGDEKLDIITSSFEDPSKLILISHLQSGEYLVSDADISLSSMFGVWPSFITSTPTDGDRAPDIFVVSDKSVLTWFRNARNNYLFFHHNMYFVLIYLFFNLIVCGFYIKLCRSG